MLLKRILFLVSKIISCWAEKGGKIPLANVRMSRDTVPWISLLATLRAKLHKATQSPSTCGAKEHRTPSFFSPLQRCRTTKKGYSSCSRVAPYHLMSYDCVIKQRWLITVMLRCVVPGAAVRRCGGADEPLLDFKHGTLHVLKFSRGKNARAGNSSPRSHLSARALSADMTEASRRI